MKNNTLGIVMIAATITALLVATIATGTLTNQASPPKRAII